MPSNSSPLPRLSVAIGVSAAVVLSAPFLGQARAALRAVFPGRFVAIVAGAVGLAVIAMMGLALVRIRHARARRYGLVALALGAAAAYALATQSGIAEVDVVERVHFVEYGVIAGLFYLAFRSLGDAASLVLPVLAALTVGTLDEWLQWFIPNRVGEARDVFLNLVAIACGLAFAVALEPVVGLAPRLSSRSRRSTAVVGSVFALVFAGFVHAVHLGHVVRDADLAFASRYDAAELRRLGSDRATRWRTDPPLTLRRLSREDQYLDEGLWHVRERNRRWTSGDYDVAWLENEILERYFAPVLDTPSYAAPEPSRWPPEQRAEARRRATPRQDLLSSAEPYPIVTRWAGRNAWLWSLVLIVVAGALFWGFRRRDQRPPQ